RSGSSRDTSMKSNVAKSAKRTIGNSPAIYRWEGDREIPVIVREADGRGFGTRRGAVPARNSATSVARFTGWLHILVVYPALKCWAIFVRPLRGLFLPVFRGWIVLVFLLTAHCSLLTANAQPGMPQPSSPL